MTTYVAWDGQEYPLPPPDGWYLAADQRWWPPGHGPTADADADADPAPDADAIPPALRGASTRSEPDQSSPDGSAEAAGAATVGAESAAASVAAPSDPIQAMPKRGRSKAGLKTILLIAVGLSVVGAAALLVITAAGDDDAAPPTSTPRTSLVLDDAPSTTADPDASTTSTVPGKGSASDPYLIGEPFRLAYDDITADDERIWEVEILGPPADGTTQVVNGNQFNEPPPEGSRYVLVPVRVTYVSGPAPASLFDLNFKVVGPSAVVLTTFSPSCGAVPDALDALAEVFPGAVLEGNVCWVVPTEDIDDLTMLVEVFLVDGDTYVALDDE